MGNVIKKHFHFNSSDGIHRIHGICWKPEEGDIKGVVQIVHGMNEFVDRYDDFARFLCAHGFVVAGEDHLGHGTSVNDESELGFFGKKNGPDYLVQDNYRVKKHMEQEFADVPYFILGHSMGSFITRLFLARYSKEIDGAIIMGTGNQSQMMLYASKVLLRLMAIGKGWKFRSAFASKMAFGNYNKKYENVRTKYDWLTKDTAIVDAYISNPLCTFTFTLAAFRDTSDMISNAGKMDTILEMRKEMPVLIVSGKEDPVGGYGWGVEAVYKKFIEADMEDVTLKLYENDRHEILNETDRDVVYEDILNWLTQYIETEDEA